MQLYRITLDKDFQKFEFSSLGKFSEKKLVLFHDILSLV